ncbi:MAG: pyridoxal phosphate-dependent aminotransferase [Planctomycetaceae bacterium]
MAGRGRQSRADPTDNPPRGFDMPRLSSLARNLQAETAFTVLARARALKAQGKDVVELEIGDSPFPSTPHAKAAGIRAIEEDRTGYGPSLGLADFRATAARFVNAEFGLQVAAENVVVASGAKPFEQYFAEALLDPGDGVLIFSPHFPTYVPNLERRGARAVLVPLAAEGGFRPRASDVANFLATDPRPRGVFLNSPHNPTGGVATAEDLGAIAAVVRGTDLQVFSDEPYCHMVWKGRHESILGRPGMLDHVVAAYTFSKSYSMSGWRVGFAVAHPEVVEAIGKLINTSASCSPPFVQWAARAALEHDAPTRDDYMARYRRKVERLADGLAAIEGVRVVPPAGTFYVFPDVRAVCDRLGITSHGLALYLLEGADDAFGVACLGGESFGTAGAGFLRFSCAEPDDRIDQALAFLPVAFERLDRVRRFLDKHPRFALARPSRADIG